MMNYGRAVVLMDQEGRVSGGMPDVSTRGGVFGPGGFGGGIFDQSLGAVWGGAKDPEVLKWQQGVNKALDEVGYERIAEDGVLGGETCGAYQLLLEDAALRDRISDGVYNEIQQYEVGPCQGYTLPKKKAGAGPPGPGPTTEAGFDANTLLMAGGIVALGVGAYLLASGKKRG